MDLRVLSAVVFPCYHPYRLQAIADGNEHHLRNNSQDRQTRHLQEENVILKEEMQRLTQQLVSLQSDVYWHRHPRHTADMYMAMVWKIDCLLALQLAYEGEGRVIGTEPTAKQIRDLQKVPAIRQSCAPATSALAQCIWCASLCGPAAVHVIEPGLCRQMASWRPKLR